MICCTFRRSAQPLWVGGGLLSCHPWYAGQREASAEGELECKRKEKTVSKGRAAGQLAS